MLSIQSKQFNRVQAESRILNRFCNALIREKNVLEGCAVLKHEHGIEIIDCMNEAELLLEVQQEGAFERYEFTFPLRFKVRGHVRWIDSLQMFFEEVAPFFQLHVSDALQKELQNSVENLELAYEAWEKKQKWVKQQLETNMMFFAKYKPNNLYQFFEELKRCTLFDEFLYTESLVIEGHPLHPSTKTKLGLSKEEVKRYAPEFEQIVPLYVLLVHKDVIAVTGDRFEKALLYEVMPDLYETAYETLVNQRKQMEDYYPFLVHPWQYEHVLTKEYEEDLEEGRIIPIPYQLSSRATLSFRTMNLLELPYHVKLPVRAQATSAVRTVSPEITVNGPILSSLFDTIYANEKELSQSVVVVRERVGATFTKNGDAHLGRNLAFILRESPHVYKQEGELLWVGASLTASNPLKEDEPVIVDIMRTYFETETIGKKEVFHYVAHYTEKVMIPLLQLVLRYGIALEGHMQNSIIVTKDGEIQRILVRDLGGVRIHKKTLAKVVNIANLKEAVVFTDDRNEVYNKFIHSVLQNHFGDVLFTLARAIDDVQEKELWRIVAAIVKEHMVGATEEQKAAIFAAQIETKALFSMRIQDKAKSYLYTKFHNPLCM
ncbi:IucA/IucC family siderophore biosynthesis protein [Bacillus cereus group sp. BfR-BA-01380]|uniref:IucA/IucC family protein n=1 Tax=Bacillus cereus group sp. BfR-BA-01380 TaxID=2920324 RepID=UPI001F55AF9B|nr:IucA/IucC family protein [Bacillus cereus group sp. BfR-BA-01380]